MGEEGEEGIDVAGVIRGIRLQVGVAQRKRSLSGKQRKLTSLKNSVPFIVWAFLQLEVKLCTIAIAGLFNF
ncbi:hypothetical protein BDE02_10G105700 [Populus trichocarpa]|nr:hypothetical protein BDE02_10G105700 [Populus trichocarpa]